MPLQQNYNNFYKYASVTVTDGKHEGKGGIVVGETPRMVHVKFHDDGTTRQMLKDRVKIDTTNKTNPPKAAEENKNATTNMFSNKKNSGDMDHKAIESAAYLLAKVFSQSGVDPTSQKAISLYLIQAKQFFDD